MPIVVRHSCGSKRFSPFRATIVALFVVSVLVSLLLVSFSPVFLFFCPPPSSASLASMRLQALLAGFLLHLSSTFLVTKPSVTMTTMLLATTCSALKCQKCLEYSGPKISKKRQESLQSCDEEVMTTCKEEETVCYDVRVRYTGKRGNSTVLQMGCGTRDMSCDAYTKEERFAECTLSKCGATDMDNDEMCETEMVASARAAGISLFALFFVLWSSL